MNEQTHVLADFARDSPVVLLNAPFPESVPILLFLKRDDLLHPYVSGNKWRKLKYNLIAARQGQFDTLLTFGGPYSNHLYATAAAGQWLGFKTIGVVRGDELRNQPLNPTLSFCQSCGMYLHFVSRIDFRRQEEPAFMADLHRQFGNFYALPEGGTNELAVRGTAEIMPELVTQLGYVPDFVCCSVGTGGTVAGLARSAPPETTVLGFSALKGFVGGQQTETCNLITEYHFGGYAKTTPELFEFIRVFERNTGVRIEQVYTGKLLYGIYDLARQGYFPDGATVAAIHTGGLQGRSPLLNHNVP